MVRRAVREPLVAALDRARALLTSNRGLLDAVAAKLLEHQTLDAAALRGIVERLHGPQPPAG